MLGNASVDVTAGARMVFAVSPFMNAPHVVTVTMERTPMQKKFAESANAYAGQVQMLSDLLPRLRAATGPSRELDAEIALAVGWTQHFWTTPGGIKIDWWISPKSTQRISLLEFTASIDAAMTLVPKGAYAQISLSGEALIAVDRKGVGAGRDYFTASLTELAIEEDGIAKAAIALCIAMLQVKGGGNG